VGVKQPLREQKAIVITQKTHFFFDGKLFVWDWGAARRRAGKRGVSLDIENYCTLRLFFDLSTLAGLSLRNLPVAGIRLLFQI